MAEQIIEMSSSMVSNSEAGYSDNQNISIDTVTYKRDLLKMAHVEKDRLDSIKKLVDSGDSIDDGSTLNDILLGISTTFLGAFFGGILEIVKMIKDNKYTSNIVVYFIFLLIAVVLFFIFINKRKIERATYKNFIERIKEQTDSIYEHMLEPNNIIEISKSHRENGSQINANDNSK